jgi:hypothetical protein
MAQKMAEWRPGTYVRVYGHVRPFQGSRHVQSFAVRTVHDFNEVGGPRGEGVGGRGWGECGGGGGVGGGGV